MRSPALSPARPAETMAAAGQPLGKLARWAAPALLDLADHGQRASYLSSQVDPAQVKLGAALFQPEMKRLAGTHGMRHRHTKSVL
jgi:hypothetical protein